MPKWHTYFIKEYYPFNAYGVVTPVTRTKTMVASTNNTLDLIRSLDDYHVQCFFRIDYNLGTIRGHVEKQQSTMVAGYSYTPRTNNTVLTDFWQFQVKFEFGPDEAAIVISTTLTKTNNESGYANDESYTIYLDYINYYV